MSLSNTSRCGTPSFCETTHFQVTAEPEAGTLPRILSVFERQHLVPDLVRCSKFSAQNRLKSKLVIQVHIQNLSAEGRLILEQKLQALVAVCDVRSETILGRSPSAESGLQLAS
ncbi:hypothetical protein [Luteithermobacter gelatinilyticus]|mgnify:CR=1 FL=1|uniref:hypothetical protein n=1 Tax=Luteithermobacter gelatinilyticus TaxID=2582913 RepID=UPI001106D1C4|nr:hypothetical protein [Luteithermobacter gelatinilyticus]|tara:strand:- start:26037 stop:26378 length:342 start_codon:yes stop_codon:yes gene_type:complete